MRQATMKPDLVFLPLEKHDLDLSFSTNSSEVSVTIHPQSLWSHEESLDAKIKRLGRERPGVFQSSWHEIGFVFSVAMSQILSEYLVSGFTVVLHIVAQDLRISDSVSVWPALAYSLAVASFLLTFGRIADMQGGYPTYMAGLIWLSMWNLIGGFSRNGLMLNICRAFQGLGTAALLPSGIMLLGSVYRPGPRKNLVFSVYGACAPFGFFLGILIAGLAGELINWGWYFWIGTALTAITTITSYFAIPSDMISVRARGWKMDWKGSVLIASGITLFIVAITDSSHTPGQWKSTRIYVLFILGSALLILAAYVERVAESPLVPWYIFRIPCMAPLIIALLLFYGSLGVFLLHASMYMEESMGATPLQTVAWYAPMAIGGCIISTIGGQIFHHLSGTILLIVAGVAWVVAPLMFAIAPENAGYWQYILPSMICATIGIDISFNLCTIFISTSLPHSQQGLAGAISSTLVSLGMAIFIAFADVVKSSTLLPLGPRKSCQAAFWFGFTSAATALIIIGGFVRIGKAESFLTNEEKNRIEPLPGSFQSLDSQPDFHAHPSRA